MTSAGFTRDGARPGPEFDGETKLSPPAAWAVIILASMTLWSALAALAYRAL
jgi:hypothetical protein